MSLNKNIWNSAVLPVCATIEQTIRNMDSVAIKIALVVDSSGVLVGTVSDGDVRRGLLKGLNLSSVVTEIMHKAPLVVTPEMSLDLVRQLMTANKIQQVPVVDVNHKVVGLHLWDDIGEITRRENILVVMAGGMGKRMRPHTENCPKPMLPIAGKPMLEHIVERARENGFDNFVLAVNYLGHMIEEYFEDGSRWGVNISYLRETKPLGTAGALKLLNPNVKDSLLVTNGDVLTDVDYGEVLDFHTRQGASATMAVRAHEWQHPFGVVKTRGIDIIGLEEKPVSRTYINAGIYVLEPDVINYIPSETAFDMPSLFDVLKNKNLRTVAYPMHEPWLDVGRPADLHEANSNISKFNFEL